MYSDYLLASPRDACGRSALKSMKSKKSFFLSPRFFKKNQGLKNERFLVV